MEEIAEKISAEVSKPKSDHDENERPFKKRKVSIEDTFVDVVSTDSPASSPTVNGICQNFEADLKLCF